MDQHSSPWRLLYVLCVLANKRVRMARFQLCSNQPSNVRLHCESRVQVVLRRTVLAVVFRGQNGKPVLNKPVLQCMPFGLRSLEIGLYQLGPRHNFIIEDLPSVLILIISDQILNYSRCCSNKYNGCLCRFIGKLYVLL